MSRALRHQEYTDEAPDRLAEAGVVQRCLQQRRFDRTGGDDIEAQPQSAPVDRTTATIEGYRIFGGSIGGLAVNMHEGFVILPFYPPSTLTYGIIVNDKGQRFINEDAYHGRVGSDIFAQHSERFYFIADIEAYGCYEELDFIQAYVVTTGDSVEELEQELGLPA